jgi:SAM-dependent methyltransferase
MKPQTEQLAKQYDSAYQQAHFFNHQAAVERPFLEILSKKAGLRNGASILDAGCGQGFFTWLFADLGFKAVGVDISREGIATAQKEYGSSGASFEVGDINELPYSQSFDCVFARCFSLYNTSDFETNHGITNVLLNYVRPGGIFIFIYYTILNPRCRSTSWNYHSMKSIARHFVDYPNTKIYFTRRSGTSLLGTFALSYPMTFIDRGISRTTGSGGYAVVLVTKS